MMSMMMYQCKREEVEDVCLDVVVVVVVEGIVE